MLLESQSNSNDKRKQSEQKVRDMREKDQVSKKIIYKDNLTPSPWYIVLIVGITLSD